MFSSATRARQEGSPSRLHRPGWPASAKENEVIGPVQLMLIGYNHPAALAAVRDAVRDLRADPAVCVLDVLNLHKGQDGTIESRRVANLTPEDGHEPGNHIETLLAEASAARVAEVPSSGAEYLFSGDVVPDPREAIPHNAGVVAILLEHLWAVPLRNTVAHTGAYPVSDAWIGRDALKLIQLIPEE